MVIKTKTKAEEIILEVAELEREIAEKKEKLTPLLDSLKEYMGDQEFMTVGMFNLFYRNVKGGELIDKKKLVADYPDVYDAVRKTGAPSRKFSYEERVINENKAN